MSNKANYTVDDTVICVDTNGANGITEGKEYKVISMSSGTTTITNDEGTSAVYLPERFILKGSEIPSIEEQIKTAKSFIGKEVTDGVSTFKATKVSVDIEMPKTSSLTCINFFEKYGYVVTVHGASYAVPVVKLTSRDISIELNPDYVAIVKENTVKVGRQEFSHEKVLELAKAIEARRK